MLSSVSSSVDYLGRFSFGFSYFKNLNYVLLILGIIIFLVRCTYLCGYEMASHVKGPNQNAAFGMFFLSAKSCKQKVEVL